MSARRCGAALPSTSATTGCPLRGHDSETAHAPLRRPALSPLRRPDACSIAQGRVFIGRRLDGPEHVDDTHVWQMPQGGVDPGEEPWPAALRELYEETNIRSVEQPRRDRGLAHLRHPARDRRPGLEGQIPRPAAEMVRAALHRRRAARSTSRIPAAATSRNSGWRWEPMKNLPALVVPFKRAVYERVVQEFAKFAKAPTCVSQRRHLAGARVCPLMRSGRAVRAIAQRLASAAMRQRRPAAPSTGRADALSLSRRRVVLGRGGILLGGP